MKQLIIGTRRKSSPAVAESRHLYYGATYLLEKFADELGLTSDLKVCFPNTYKQLLSIAFYLILEDNNPLYHFEDLDILGFGKTRFIMDRGFCSEDNINGLYKEHIKFLVEAKISLRFIRKHLDKIHDDIRMFVNYDADISTLFFRKQFKKLCEGFLPVAGCHDIRMSWETATLEQFMTSHATVCSKSMVYRELCRAHGTAAVTTSFTLDFSLQKNHN